MATIKPDNWGIELKRLSGVHQALIYSESNCRLHILLELAGFGRGYHWIAAEDAFNVWTEPSDAPIGQDEQDNIRARIVAWATSRGISVGFEPAAPPDITERKMREAGYTPKQRPDGTVEWTK